MLNHHPHSTSSPLWLPPAHNRIADFNFILKQLPVTLFVEDTSNEMVLLFPSESALPGSHHQAQTFSLRHTLFLTKGGEAAQLEELNSSTTVGQYFLTQCRHPNGTFTLEVERDFEQLTIRDKSGPIPERVFHQSEPPPYALDMLFFNPIPARPRVVGHTDLLGHIIFTFEQFGAHPKISGPLSACTFIRGFRGDPSSWQEFEVCSAKVSGGGLHNLSLHTELGYFFFPGNNSLDAASFTPPDHAHASLVIRDFDPEFLLDPRSGYYDHEAARAMRSLGLPAQWPPADFF